MADTLVSGMNNVSKRTPHERVTAVNVNDGTYHVSGRKEDEVLVELAVREATGERVPRDQGEELD